MIAERLGINNSGLLSVFYTVERVRRLLSSNIRRKPRGFIGEDLESRGSESQSGMKRPAFLFSVSFVKNVSVHECPFLFSSRSQCLYT